LGKYPFYTNKCLFLCVLQSKVKNLCAAYKCLLKTHRDGILKVLACDYAVDHQMVCKAAKSLVYIEVRLYITLCWIHLSVHGFHHSMNFWQAMSCWKFHFFNSCPLNLIFYETQIELNEISQKLCIMLRLDTGWKYIFIT
jgi:hypothetical protein